MVRTVCGGLCVNASCSNDEAFGFNFCVPLMCVESCHGRLALPDVRITYVRPEDAQDVVKTIREGTKTYRANFKSQSVGYATKA